MALTVGELAVELEAKTGEFKRRLDDAEHRLGRFEDQATRRTARAGASFRKLANQVGRVGAAFAGLAAAAGAVAIVRIGRSAIQTAAQFEQLEIRLATFLGSQEAATASLERFVEMSAKTPFAVGDIVEGATTLATVTGEDAKALEELVTVTANLSAVTGLDFPTAAANLQRSLAAGLASADLFREKGVRQLLEANLGLKDATKLTAGATGDLARAFKAVFGEAGRYGTAAEDLSDSLGGALSNVGDAAERFKAKLGEALAPGVIEAARQVIIPFFDELRRLVEENEEEITGFAREAIPALFQAFTTLIRTASVLVRGIGYLTVAFDVLKVVLAAVQAGFVYLYGVLKYVVDAARLGATIISNGVSAIKLALQGNLVEAAKMADRNEEAWRLWRARVADTVLTVEAAGETVIDVAKEVGDNKHFYDSLADALNTGAEAAGRMAGRMEELGKATKTAADQANRAAPAFRTGGGLPAIQPVGGAESVLAMGEGFDLFEEEKSRRKIESIYRAGGLLGGEETEDLTEGFASEMASSVVDGIGGALLELAGGGDMQTFAQSLGNLAQDFLSRAFDKATEGLEKALTKVFEGLEQKSAGLAAGVSAAIGIGLALVSGALRKTTATVTDAAIESAVTSTQQVRGVVAGPTQIAIGEVASGIQDAFDPLLILDQERNRILNDLLTAVRSSSGSAELVTATGAEIELAETSVSLP